MAYVPGIRPTYGSYRPFQPTGFSVSRSGFMRQSRRSEGGGDPVPTSPASSTAFNRLGAFGGRVGIQDPEQNQTFVWSGTAGDWVELCRSNN